MHNNMVSKEKKEGFLGQKMVVIPENIKSDIWKNPIINNMFITDIGYYPNAKHHYRQRQTGAAEYILIYCVEGQGWITCKEEKFELEPNSYLIIPQATKHTYGAEESDPWSIYWIHFTGHRAETAYGKYSSVVNQKNQKPHVVHIPFEQRRIKYFNKIISLLESGYSRELVEYINISLWQLLASFIYHNFFSEVRGISKETNIVNATISYMKNNLDQSISVNDIATHINYSSSYLYSFFKAKTGYPPIQYFTHLKIQKACQFLSFTDLSVKEISYKLGFNDPFYFSRLFKKVMKYSPTDYRDEF